MVNILTIALTHAIMLLAAWRIMLRDDLEFDPEVKPEPVPGSKNDAPQKPARKSRSRVRPRA